MIKLAWSVAAIGAHSYVLLPIPAAGGLFAWVGILGTWLWVGAAVHVLLGTSLNGLLIRQRAHDAALAILGVVSSNSMGQQ